MKSKPLANVLIKILGLSLGVHSIPTLISGIVGAFASSLSTAPVRMGSSGRFTPLFAGTLVELALGIALILKSKDVAEYLFKREDE